MTEIFLRAALAGDVWVLYLLVIASVLSVAVMTDRWLVFRRHGGRIADLLAAVTARLAAGDVAGARAAAEAHGGLEGRVTAVGLEHFPKGPDTVEEAMTARLILERVELERRLIILGTLGNNAPFIGLFGTVLGIIKAFHDLAVSGSSGVSVVMAGISSALVATAFGILVAIPAVIANNYFQTRVDEMVSHAQSLTRILLAHLKASPGSR